MDQSDDEVLQSVNDIEDIWVEVVELLRTYDKTKDPAVRFMIMKKFRDVADKIEEMESQIENNLN